MAGACAASTSASIWVSVCSSAAGSSAPPTPSPASSPILTPPVNENTAYIRNTVNKYSAIGEMNFARSPSMYLRVSLPGCSASSGSVRHNRPSKCSTECEKSCQKELRLRWICAGWPHAEQ